MIPTMSDTFAPLIVCFDFNCGYLRKQMQDIPADRIDDVPADGLKAPRWLLGHLAEGHQYLVNYLGLDDSMPEIWVQAFAPGTPSSAPYGLDDASQLPSADELLDYISRTQQPISEAAAKTPLESLSDPHGIELLDGTGFHTQADLVAHLLSSHYAFHLGQLSLWRRAAGIDPLF